MEEFYVREKARPESNGRTAAAPTGSRSQLDRKKHVNSWPGTSPVSIPVAARRRRHDVHAEEELAASLGGAELVPPHVLMSRRTAEGEMAFSLCSGAGRTLKGRDLSQVRNSVLRMTGFIES